MNAADHVIAARRNRNPSIRMMKHGRGTYVVEAMHSTRHGHLLTTTDADRALDLLIELRSAGYPIAAS